MVHHNQRTNRLIGEKSPYLLQHVHNPVDWHPWGSAAFALAAAQDRPVFLSIGYSTCHWCHVMAHESFEDIAVADALNSNYVCIKVDREERPDIDAVYMSVCQALTGSGGWPLTIIMTPEQKPFWAGTYLPKTMRYGRPGLLELLAAVTAQWKQNRDQLIDAGEQISALLTAPEQTVSAEPDIGLVTKAVQLYTRNFDSRWGGFGAAPKFPTPHNLLFLLRYSVVAKDEHALKIAEHTLLQMFRGGIFDHVGGGFSRYSTDEKWLVPHFEKMLYDNALLAFCYLEAFAMSERPLYRTVAMRTLDYILRELTDPLGGFYCGQDADSDGVEGKYYVFTPQELISVLGKDGSDNICRWFGVTPKGNFEGKSILNLLDNPGFEEPNSDIATLCQTLYDYRLTRTRLHKDDKALTSWNALAIAAFAKAGWLLEEPRYLNAAQNAQCFIARLLTDNEGRLHIRWREGEAAHDGQLDDYAFYAFALLELYQATFDATYLAQAINTATNMIKLFSDNSKGGFFLYAHDSEQLIVRPKEVYDGALPSGNSVAAVVLGRLAKLTGEPLWQQAAERQLAFVSSAMSEYPAGYSFSLLALLEALYPAYELVCTTSDSSTLAALNGFFRANPVQNLSLLVKTPSHSESLAKIAPFTVDYPLPDHGAAYYLCRDNACGAPVYTLDALHALLRNFNRP